MIESRPSLFMILVHGACSNQESFEKYKKWITNATPKGWELREVVCPDISTFPGLAISLIDNTSFFNERLWDVHHTFVSKDALLVALGLSTKELEVKLGMISDPVPEVLESREV